MEHADHVRLLASGVPQGEGGAWADLGAGAGAFTLALADLIGPHGLIHAVDRDRGALTELHAAAVSAIPTAEIRTTVGDFTRRLDLADLDGVVMANSLHFIEDKLPVLALVREYLRPGGRLLLVEYDSDRGNPWVPHPITFETWRQTATAAGFVETRKLATVPSRFLGRIYSALSLAA
ncbi:MAG TPA: class I SAM-dependent methyltransferase [Candidatus Limnocylindria bacterium]|jgi:ubiquinone/menaquinone biosynthesis C-methylase UbiE|nr:class I SAM-dependent methyltransferase [Candidatus Limnocylindria bacterium]